MSHFHSSSANAIVNRYSQESTQWTFLQDYNTVSYKKRYIRWLLETFWANLLEINLKFNLSSYCQLIDTSLQYCHLVVYKEFKEQMVHTGTAWEYLLRILMPRLIKNCLRVFKKIILRAFYYLLRPSRFTKLAKNYSHHHPHSTSLFSTFELPSSRSSNYVSILYTLNPVNTGTLVVGGQRQGRSN